MEIIPLILSILENWWWVILPIILWFSAKNLYLWWMQWEVWYPKVKWILLEVKSPKEILKPFTAMEDVLSVLWGIYDGANWRQRWCEGQLPMGAYWMSFEIVSIGGSIRFLIRCTEGHRGLVETSLYGHYPDIEISLVDDYIKDVPKNIPDKDIDLYGEDFILLRENAYPIKTYPKFFEPAGERISEEEKRIDPLKSLLESLAGLKPGEQFWFQIVIAPIINQDIPWETEGNQIIEKMTGRAAQKTKPKPMVQEAVELWLPGWSPKAPSKEKELIPPEMKLTPGEREIILAIGNKISKPAFRVWSRGVYIAKRDAWNPKNRFLARSYLLHFNTRDLNGFFFLTKTRTRVHYWFVERWLFIRKRKMFENAVNRFPPLWPISPLKGTPILNIEELATIFHLPSQITVSTLPYVESKKGGPPPTLPFE